MVLACIAADYARLRRPVVGGDPLLVLAALELKTKYRLSYWDAAIVAAAQTLGASRLYSEDLNDGQNYAGVMVHNPFV